MAQMNQQGSICDNGRLLVAELLGIGRVTFLLKYYRNSAAGLEEIMSTEQSSMLLSITMVFSDQSH